GSHLLESGWIAVPTLLLAIIFVGGYNVYRSMTHAPAGALEIRVIGKQWLWQFIYDNGKTSVNELYVPVNRPIKLIMTSEDVIHSFFVPDFRIKQDVVPGMYTSIWFEAKLPGKHQIFCAEYCGTSHSGMLGQVVVLGAAQWQAWNRGEEKSMAGEAPEAGEAEPVGLAAQGAKAFAVKGCVTCHSVDGSQKVGPSLKGIFGREVELGDGTTVTVDENYVRESIEKPQAKVVKGFQPVMPTFQGLMTEAELSGLIAYLKSLQ
ncbi:MAG: cytochrome c oxidase subunit II, partial [Oligoflexia bacterium]|nr:cytochrome c oxidase subunit II [Oligoflexia bacterium]